MRWTTGIGLLVATCIGLQSSAAEAQDLTVSSFTTKVTGTTVTFTVKVCNTGASITSDFDVDLYYNRPTGPACGELGDDWDTIHGLASGACSTLSFMRAATPPATYTAWARADSTCLITETNEGNNNASTSYTVSPLADLNITSFTTTVSGSTVTFNVTVCNLGASAAGSFFVDLYYNRTTGPTCGVTGDQYVQITNLTPGACTTKTFTRTGTPNGSYTSWARADALCTINESDENNNNASATYTVGSPLPDLNVALTTSVSGSTVTFTAKVCNVGAGPANDFDVDIYYNSAVAPTCGILGDAFQNVASLAAGACTTLTFTRTGTASGSYTGWARADSTCLLAESNEGNNNASSPYTVNPLPDLRVANFTSTVSGTTVTFNVRVCNNGAALATSFWLDLYYNRTTAPSCGPLGDTYASIAALGPGACTNLTLTRTATPPGTYTAWAMVDSGCTVTESNETNNTASTTYTVGAPPAPDLTVTLTTTVAGTTVTFNVNVCNKGGATTASFDVDVYYNSATAPACPTLGDQYVTITGLAAGACSAKTFTRTNTPAGSYTGWARVDSGCTVTESNETNNNASSSYNVGTSLPDLLVQNFTATVSGNTVTFDVEVCNNGGTAASNVNVELYYNLTAAPGCTSTHDQQTTIPSLAAATCTTRTFTRTAAPVGSYTAWVRADADCTISESNENNNNSQAAYSVSAPPADLGILPDVGRPDFPKTEASVTADTGRTPDGGVKTDTGGITGDTGLVAEDGAPSADRGADSGKTKPKTSSGGCSCELVTASDRSATLLLVALFGLTLVARRRRRR